MQLSNYYWVVEHGGVLDHGGLWLEVGSGVIPVEQNVGVCHIGSEGVAGDAAGREGPPSERPLGTVSRLDNWPFFDPPVLRGDWDAAPAGLRPSAHSGGEWPAESSTNEEPLAPLPIVLLVKRLLGVVWHSLWTKLLLEVASDPWLFAEVLLKPMERELVNIVGEGIRCVP